MVACRYAVTSLIKAALHVGSQCNTQGSGAPIDSVVTATTRDKILTVILDWFTILQS